MDSIISSIKAKPAVLVYFSGEGCGVCKALQPKIKEAFSTNFPKIEQIYLDVKQYNKVAVEFNVFSIPTILIFLDGKEFLREGRNCSIDLMIQKINRPYNMFFES